MEGNMNKEEIILKIKKIIGETTDIENSEALISTEDLINEKGINSMDAISILVAVEDTFEIEVDDQDLSAELVRTIDNIADYVINKLNK